MEKIFVGNKVIGFLDNGTFTKKVTPKKHYMKIFKGYGIQTEVLSKLWARGCTTVVINTGKATFESDLQAWMDSEFIKDFGHGRQTFMPLDKMKEALDA